MKLPSKMQLRRRLSLKRLIISMLCLSAFFYILHYIIFRDLHHIAIFALHVIAFLPIEVILTSLIFERVLDDAHHHEQRGKVNMIESIFFNESGSDMLRYLLRCDPQSQALCQAMHIDESWDRSRFEQAHRFADEYAFTIDPARTDFFALHYHLENRHKYFLKVIENPALMDHEGFTDLILAMYHLWEELDFRTDLYQLSEQDKQALCAIISQIYRLLTHEWLLNVSYTKRHHESRFAGAVRTNPFAFFDGENRQ